MHLPTAATRRHALALFTAPLLAATLFGAAPAGAAGITGSGNLVTDKRSLPEFRAIELSGSMDLVVRQGPQEVQVVLDHNLLEHLETVVEERGGTPTLRVRWKRGSSFSTRSRVGVTVSVPQLSAIAASGSGDIRLESFNTPALKVALSGSGDARLAGLTTGELAIAISGSGDVSGQGSATKLSIGISGSGDVRLAEMKAEDVKVSIAGSGDASVAAAKTLEVSIAGSGDVTYTGNPAVRSSVAGSGSVTRR
jgi:carbon monoxide dehydrogenase subunit G